MQYESEKVESNFPHDTVPVAGREGKHGMEARTHTGPPPPPAGAAAGKALSSNKNISLWVYILWLASLISSQHPKR